jgi:hypothetical protein
MATTAPSTLQAPPLPRLAGAVAQRAVGAPALLAEWATTTGAAPGTSWTLAHVPALDAFPAALRGRSVVLVADAGAVVAGLRAALEPPAHAAPDVELPLAALSPTTIDVLLRCAGPASGLLAVDVRRLAGAPVRFVALAVALADDRTAEAALGRLVRALAPWRGAPAPTTRTTDPGPTAP